MRKSSTSRWLLLPALAVAAAFGARDVDAQTHVEVDVEGYLCREAVDAEKFQQLASANPRLSRKAALAEFNEETDQPRCKWYERSLMIYKGTLKQDEGEKRFKYLFVGGDGGVFEVLVFETLESAETLYSWRRTEGEAG